MWKRIAIGALLVLTVGCLTPMVQKAGQREHTPSAARAGDSAEPSKQQQAIDAVFRQHATSWPDSDKFPRTPGKAEATIVAGGPEPTRLPAVFETASEQTADGYLVTLTMRWGTKSFATAHYSVSSDGSKVVIAGTEGQTIPQAWK